MQHTHTHIHTSELVLAFLLAELVPFAQRDESVIRVGAHLQLQISQSENVVAPIARREAAHESAGRECGKCLIYYAV